ncbi:MAG: dethiobiotin synthase [Candidatus Omnitrophica bacterium]|nr:dethiobiotin synthase [Candidatus Omnitrophota bacterium]
MKAIFVTATDTGAGKTTITGLFARYLSEKGFKVATQKWVQTGSRGFPEDLSAHLRFMGKDKKAAQDIASYLCPYVFRLAASPHLACLKEKKSIKKMVIKKAFRFLCKNFDYVIVEGTGGLLVPFGAKGLIIDIASELKLPVLLVAANRLGGINHALLACEAVLARKMELLGVIFNTQDTPCHKAVIKDNPLAVKKITGIGALGLLPRVKDPELLYRKFIPTAINILKRMERLV